MKPTVININKMSLEEIVAFKSGDPRYVYIGRANTIRHLKGSKWANAHEIAHVCKTRKCSISAARDIVVEQYREDILHNPKLMAALPELSGKILVCYCSPLRCHGHILAELVEQMESVNA